MEKTTHQEIVIAKNKERYQKLKRLRDNLEKPNTANNLVAGYLKEFLDFPEITAKEINSLNISKILKKYWESPDREVKNLTNDLILKWKKIAKAASEGKMPKASGESEGKEGIKISNAPEEIKQENSIKKESIILSLNSDPYDDKIEQLKNLINSNPELKYVPNLRRTTKILLFESIAKIVKDKFLQCNKAGNLSLSSEKNENDITTSSSLNPEDFEKELKFIVETTEKIEATLNELFKDAKEKYIRKAKSIISNLRINSELYSALFEEKISPEEIAKMDEKVNFKKKVY